VATLYRCKTPTNWLCACGRVERKLRSAGLDHDTVRVPFRKRERPEVEAVSDQRWVPVFVHGEEVVSDSHRIVEYVDWISTEKD
jgi:glutathione S-transferase